MKGLNLRSLQMVALLAAAAGLSACKAKLTFVHVQILPAAAGEPSPITDIELQLDLAGKPASVHLTDPGHGPIQLPTDVTLQVKTGSGQLAIIAIARNAAGDEVDRATGTAQVSSGAIAQASLQLPGGRPDLQPTEPSHEFGAAPEGVALNLVNVSFVNHGFRASGATSVAIGGVGASSWTVGSNTCSGGSLAPGASCVVGVQFRPLAPGTLAATLTLSASPGGSAVVALTGTGSNNPQNVSVTLSGNGVGTVSTAGLTCTTGTCTHAFDYGAQVTLTATAATGSHFTNWSGPCTGTGTCSITVTAATTVFANFALDTENLTVAATGNGIVTSVGVFNCGALAGSTNCGPHPFDYGTTVSLNAVALSGSHFVSWSEPACGNTNPCTFNVASSHTVTATFALNAHTVTVTLSGTGAGEFSSADTKLDCLWASPVPQSGTCLANYNFGDSFIINAVPDATSYVNGGGITGDASNGCTSGPPPCSVNVGDNDIVINLTFDRVTLTVNANPGNGTGTTQCSTNGGAFGPCNTAAYNRGDTVAIAATANVPDSQFSTWSGCDSVSGTGGATCNLTMTSARTVTPTFNLKTFVVAVTGPGFSPGAGSGAVTGAGGLSCTITNGVSSGTCSAVVNYGSGYTLSETPAPGGNAFVSWAGGCVGVAASCSFTNITSTPSTTVASFTQTFVLTVTIGGNASATGNVTSSPGGVNCGNGVNACQATFNYGQALVLTPNSTGNVQSGWSGPCATSSGKCVFTITANTSATGYFNAIGNFCGTGYTPQVFTGGVMHGCSIPKVGATNVSPTYLNRLNACAPGCRVAYADEYVNHRNNQTPSHNYWVEEYLKFSSGSTSCGQSGCNTGACFATNGTTFGIQGGNPMKACTASNPDPEGNTCTWTQCGYNSVQPIVYFGGVSTAGDATAGALCICGVQAWWVDAVNGADTNEGSSALPFATITHALAVAGPNQVVHVRPGLYDSAHGESFPIAIPPNVDLLGDEANRGTGGIHTKISGCSASTGNVTLAAGSTLAGFEITTSCTSFGAVYLNGNNATVRNNSIINNSGNYGVYVTGGTTGLTIVLNSLGAPGAANFGGVRFLSPATTGKFENNSVLNNLFGVVLDATPPSMGDNQVPVVSVGNNSISCNTNADLYLSSSLVGGVNAQFNRWDHGPPGLFASYAGSGFGYDLMYNGGGVTYGTANLLVASPCP